MECGFNIYFCEKKSLFAEQCLQIISDFIM